MGCKYTGHQQRNTYYHSSSCGCTARPRGITLSLSLSLGKAFRLLGDTQGDELRCRIKCRNEFQIFHFCKELRQKLQRGSSIDPPPFELTCRKHPLANLHYSIPELADLHKNEQCEICRFKSKTKLEHQKWKKSLSLSLGEGAFTSSKMCPR